MPAQSSRSLRAKLVLRAYCVELWRVSRPAYFTFYFTPLYQQHIKSYAVYLLKQKQSAWQCAVAFLSPMYLTTSFCGCSMFILHLLEHMYMRSVLYVCECMPLVVLHHIATKNKSKCARNLFYNRKGRKPKFCISAFKTHFTVGSILQNE